MKTLNLPDHDGTEIVQVFSHKNRTCNCNLLRILIKVFYAKNAFGEFIKLIPSSFEIFF